LNDAKFPKFTDISRKLRTL